MNNASKNILVIDDDINICLSVKLCLENQCFHVDSANSISSANSAIERKIYDCLLIDIRLGEESGIDLFNQLKSKGHDIPVILISGNASLEEAAQTHKLGAFDFLEKPFSSDKLFITVTNCIEHYRLKRKIMIYDSNNSSSLLIGEHALMHDLKKAIKKVSVTDAVVLIQGESGTGKELIASEIHNQSLRSKNEMVRVNCSAIPENLIESALFGHTKGAFTGANVAKKGFFEQAHNGSIFLDEIGDMPLSVQANLLRVLESKEIQKIGSESVIKVNVRVIAATHKNLKLEVERGNFRLDLFYRINVIPINSPALRYRLSDLELLVAHISSKLCLRHGLSTKKIDNACIKIFEQYNWPGNVRELTNILERMIIMGGDRLRKSDIPQDILVVKSKMSDDISLKAFRAESERKLIVNRLNLFKGNISQVARSLEIDRTNLHKKINMYRIERERDFY